jgi:hypothetical protein
MTRREFDDWVKNSDDMVPRKMEMQAIDINKAPIRLKL